ncbi:hypothetical protein H4Q26_016402 [Puccinia striiformis f. sp. tritici PST-130]|nr:hypothetical protein H4Q26_016402 [Puccinia striiformis f. sp. tritici PST-130]
MEYWIKWSSYRDQARKMTRENLSSKFPISDKTTDSLVKETLEALYYSDPFSFFSGQEDLHIDQILEPNYSFSKSSYSVTSPIILNACNSVRDQKLIEVCVPLDDQDAGQCNVLMNSK